MVLVNNLSLILLKLVEKELEAAGIPTQVTLHHHN